MYPVSEVLPSRQMLAKLESLMPPVPLGVHRSVVILDDEECTCDDQSDFLSWSSGMTTLLQTRRCWLPSLRREGPGVGLLLRNVNIVFQYVKCPFAHQLQRAGIRGWRNEGMIYNEKAG